MKKAIIGIFILVSSLYSCNKSNSNANSVSLATSSTVATVGQAVAVTAVTSANTVSWTATPAASTAATYSVTTEKTNYFTFTTPGQYVVGVVAKGLSLDSIHVCNHVDSIGHHLPDSLWNHHVDSLWHARGNDRGGCKNGVDSASIIITVK